MNEGRNHLGAVGIVEGIANGSFTAEDVMRDCLTRVEQREPEIGAFIHLDPQAAMDAARAADARTDRGPLHGVPFAIKDIIDTVGQPTGWGSPIYEGNCPPRNASCVELMIRAGAVPIGKTVSTEFAYFQPGSTANPHNPAHTPGGSSSGSAAAVADFMAPLAFGSQTAASLIRPAAYCGILGYKPSHGAFDLQGVMGLAPNLDTLGLMARQVEDLVQARSVLCGSPAEAGLHFADRVPRISLMRGPHWQEGSIEMRDTCQRALAFLAEAGAETGEISHPPGFAGLTECQKTVMAFEAARARLYEYQNHRQVISDTFADLMEIGLATSRRDYEQARQTASLAGRVFDALFSDIDVILAPAAPGEAPPGLGATGDPLYSRGWTLLKVPCLTIPFGSGPHGLPLSFQIIGRFGEDDRLLATAKWIEERLGDAVTN